MLLITASTGNISDFLDSMRMARHEADKYGKQDEVYMLSDVCLVMLSILPYKQVTFVTFVLQQVTSVTLSYNR